MPGKLTYYRELGSVSVCADDVMVGGDPFNFYTQKILNINGTAPPGCPAGGMDNVFKRDDKCQLERSNS